MKNKELSKIDTRRTSSPRNIPTKATNTTPLQSPHDRDGYVHQILSPVPSPNRPIISSFSMSSSSPRRSIYLGIDVGTGSARAGPFTPLSIFSYRVPLYGEQFQPEKTCFLLSIYLFSVAFYGKQFQLENTYFVLFVCLFRVAHYRKIVLVREHVLCNFGISC